MKIPLNLIKPSPRPVRSTWDERAMIELTESIKAQGLIVPIKARPVEGLPKPCPYHGYGCLGDTGLEEIEDTGWSCDLCEPIREWVYAEDYTTDEGEAAWDFADEPQQAPFEIVYGHRRVEACRRAGLKEIEVIVEGMEDTPSLLQQIMENESKEDVPYEAKALGYVRALEATGWDMNELARQTGISYRTIVHSQQWLARKRVGAAVSDELIPTKGRHVGASGVDQTLQIGRVLGDDIETSKAVAVKVSQEGLTGPQTRRVAESIKAAKTPERKKALLEYPYSTTLHDPEMEKARPLHVIGEKASKFDWAAYPETSQILDNIRGWEDKLEDMRKADEVGKLSPEAGRFLARRIHRLVVALSNWEKALGDKYGKGQNLH